MRWLIDGYNVMHAGGRLPPELGREGFRRERRRFLDDVAAALGPERAGQTTVVFDASVPPGDFPIDTHYQGLRVVFALDDADADSRIEWMLEHDANPQGLTVVSTDRRIRQAARRRRARPLTADAFWVWLDELREQARRPRRPHPPSASVPNRPSPIKGASSDRGGDDDAAYWLEVFGDVDVSEAREALASNDRLLTDAEIAEIQRQVDREP